MTFRATWDREGSRGESRHCHRLFVSNVVVKAFQAATVSAALIVAGRAPAFALNGQHSGPAPHSTPAPHAPAAPRPQQAHSYPSHPQGQQHLNEWLQRNKNLTPQEQTQKLHQEPGFNRLPPQQQQQVTQRLEQLNRMPPEQRQRTLERVENLERLPPERQQQVRGSAQRLSQSAPERQQVMREAIRDLRSVPPGLRQQELSSSRYSSLTPEERAIVGNMVTIEPYHPAPPPPR